VNSQKPRSTSKNAMAKVRLVCRRSAGEQVRTAADECGRAIAQVSHERVLVERLDQRLGTAVVGRDGAADEVGQHLIGVLGTPREPAGEQLLRGCDDER
jgi:hypothetical protein